MSIASGALFVFGCSNQFSLLYMGSPIVLFYGSDLLYSFFRVDTVTDGLCHQHPVTVFLKNTKQMT